MNLTSKTENGKSTLRKTKSMMQYLMDLTSKTENCKSTLGKAKSMKQNLMNLTSKTKNASGLIISKDLKTTTKNTKKIHVILVNSLTEDSVKCY
ncbi:hypothetical protein BCR32DRAFT_275973 [Anaeromyces robustus]|uniref:Uncharacterized protein n=1 Tax=Anaeromyces robustus TaxID=1754192 RepID=A0A1Y1XJ91_9FUNG|nr:hypothetical protein BCR32DRAFT_275973 [Anaeromyces robustus]|eukprot:ORX85762.1 hypothetical protein BCR32DRAFT_275973 [Anaeromyces robustus]